MKKYLKVVHNNRAGFGLRVANYFVDYAVVWGIFFVFGLIAAALSQYLGLTIFADALNALENLTKLQDILLTTGVTLVYYFLMEHYANGRTIGKFVTGTQVISTDGTKPDATQILYRTLSRIVPFDGFSFAFAENGWHDKWSDTRVVKIKDYEKAINLDNDISQIGVKETS